MNLFWKILRWMLLGGILCLVVLFVWIMWDFGKAVSYKCEVNDVIEQMETFVEYDFDSDDYVVVNWFCSGAPDWTKEVTFSFNNKTEWKEISKSFRKQRDTTFSIIHDSSVEKIEIVINSDSYTKNCVWMDIDETVTLAKEQFILNYKNKVIKYNYLDY